MPIAYSLIDNKLTADPNDLRAQVQSAGTATLDDLANDVVRPGSTVTKAEFLAMYEEFKMAVIHRAQRGETIITDLFVLRPTLTGVWRDAHDTFDPQRHRGQLRLAAGTLLRRAETELRFTLVSPAGLTEPRPERVEDLLSEAVNDTLTTGTLALLRGTHLKHDPTDPDQGLFLVPATGSNAPVRVDKVKKNTPSEQLFLVPATLPAGTYRLEVRNKLRGSNTLRTAALPATLTIA
ncbi:DNA-binding domain-containing protein [Hymenobacter sp. ASUV-10]|uniref:DNA-binding domain-containing protein n=1 Tax=Hymenobacter aranciens TaxID=3063996 RepID=A0ABT9BGB9_9BACT|nr:DNA-binding domain-containing protein [Hymenobacter sp. ASUV-10]MDO7877307.1 DNA-binding domain-containing protein [Hymenobacter sp. ASUV-10]